MTFTPMQNSCLMTFKKMQKQPLEKFCKKTVLKNFAILTGQHLCWRLFLIQNIVKFFRAPILKNICKRLLLKMFMKLRKVRNSYFNSTSKNRIFQHQYQKQVKMCISWFLFHGWFSWSLYLHTVFLWCGEK